ncbi:GlxA family transcriptional regulator [Euzebya tangerina]|uniref:GlxA family transcriptional regulator n=1 Tax=Euzebya tangerina TaxID=591198 RepID=UPI000E3227CC|nr:GlxA family transcriptional regulator [Euzebya tangerina]
MDSPSAHNIVFLAYDGIQTLDLAGPHDVFAGANAVLADQGRQPAYQLTVVTPTGSVIASESGLRIATVRVAEAPDPLHTLVIPGGIGTRTVSNDPAFTAVAETLGRRASRVLTICSGAFVAAAAGLLDGHTVTTHWARADGLARRFPDVTVDPEPIYIEDGAVWSSAGVTAGIDLALAIVEHDHDVEVAQRIARWLVMFLRRPGGQSQFATPVWTDRARTGPIRQAQHRIDEDPGADHRVAVMARRAGMSQRHFTRRFSDEVGLSPARYVAAVRLEAARRSLESSDATVSAIAGACGFGTAETMRRTFVRRLRTSPDQYRRRFRATPETPTPDRTRSSA